jgi:hypothetical protein
VNEHIAAAIVRLDESEALLAVEPLHSTCRHFLLSKARKRVPRDNHAVISTSSMSLEKEPAGAFNKAQRLIECGLDIDELRVLQGAEAT